MGTSRTPTDAGAPQRVSPSSLHQTYKSHDVPQRKVSPILASPSTYQTRSHYTLDSPALYWNLPPLTWNLNDGSSPELPPRRKKARRRKPKKQPPVKHRQTHAAFCRDPLCPFHH